MIEGKRDTPGAGLLYVPYLAAGVPEAVPEGLLGAGFPAPDLVSVAGAAFPRVLPTWQGEEGPRARIVVSPGSITVALRDLAKAERSAERARERRLRTQPVDLEEVDGSREAVSEWSRRSRARMVATICALDLTLFTHTERATPAMITLTYPGDWLAVAPDGQTAKRHLWALRRRFARAFGRALAALWKLEFQERGAPHFHLLVVLPAQPAADGRRFGAWLSQTWADIVGHPDPIERAKHVRAGTGIDIAEGLRASDPRRVAVYFTKHSSANFGDKEYQHVVPEAWRASGPGRFWGYWGLEKVEAVVEVPIDDAIAASRILRRWARAQGTTRQETVWRAAQGRFRKVRRRVRRMKGSAGFLAVNNGPGFAWQLARALERGREPWQWTAATPI